MKVEIHKNFLEKQFFLSLKSLITDIDFPWRFRPRMTNSDSNENFYFTYSFFNELKINSTYYDNFIIPILNQLNCIAPIQIRANLNIKKKGAKSGWHIDYPTKSKTAILYLNNCDGGTELQLKGKNKFIKSEENKIVIFDASIKHRGIVQTDTQTRYFLNLNYFDINTK
tara:strand:+ start:206 stop:712 length:507 start_codon:yes stop_codon:yes gene_type:complete